MGRNRKSIPPLLTLDPRYIWFPILTYVIFFFVAMLIILISKYIEKKKGKKENKENSLKWKRIKEIQIQKRISQGENVFIFG